MKFDDFNYAASNPYILLGESNLDKPLLRMKNNEV